MRYLTTFAVKRDIFRAFFGHSTEANGINPSPYQALHPPAQSTADSRPCSLPGSDLILGSPEGSPRPEAAIPTAPEPTGSSPPSSPLASTSPPGEISSQLVHSTSAWQLARQYSTPSERNILTVISPISPYDEGVFRVERPNVEKVLQMTKVLDVRGQNVEHVYMSHSDMAGLKFVDGKTIIRQAYKTSNHTIFKIPIGIVDTLKHQYESMTSMSR